MNRATPVEKSHATSKSAQRTPRYQPPTLTEKRALAEVTLLSGGGGGGGPGHIGHP